MHLSSHYLPQIIEFAVMRSTRFVRRLGCLWIAALLALSGCGEPAVTPPKKDLSEREKQQIRELNEQRASEWASTKRK
jgi:hypothetical protein